MNYRWLSNLGILIYCAHQHKRQTLLLPFHSKHYMNLGNKTYQKKHVPLSLCASSTTTRSCWGGGGRRSPVLWHVLISACSFSSYHLSHAFSPLVGQLLISSPMTKAALYPSVSLVHTQQKLSSHLLNGWIQHEKWDVRFDTLTTNTHYVWISLTFKSFR